MWKGCVAVVIAVAGGLLLSFPSRGQNAASKAATPAAAPRHDVSGIWTPARGPSDGIGPFGARDMPEDGKPEHQLPYTPLALEKMKSYRPGNGAREVLPTDINDPAVIYCDPQGMPRQDLYELRDTQILQTPLSVVILYQFSRIWRVIWADGRELPKDPDPRWFGYSVGKWVDDYTFVAQTSGTDPRTWLDKGGRPHSADLHIEEKCHRVNRDLLELTVTIDDPKMYTRSWVALNKFPMKLLPPDTEVREMICSVSEFMDFNKRMGFGNPTATNTGGVVKQAPQSHGLLVYWSEGNLRKINSRIIMPPQQDIPTGPGGVAPLPIEVEIDRMAPNFLARAATAKDVTLMSAGPEIEIERKDR